MAAINIIRVLLVLLPTGSKQCIMIYRRATNQRARTICYKPTSSLDLVQGEARAGTCASIRQTLRLCLLWFVIRQYTTFVLNVRVRDLRMLSWAHIIKHSVR